MTSADSLRRRSSRYRAAPCLVARHVDTWVLLASLRRQLTTMATAANDTTRSTMMRRKADRDGVQRPAKQRIWAGCHARFCPWSFSAKARAAPSYPLATEAGAEPGNGMGGTVVGPRDSLCCLFRLFDRNRRVPESSCFHGKLPHLFQKKTIRL